jgi:hypothetical protein
MRLGTYAHMDPAACSAATLRCTSGRAAAAAAPQHHAADAASDGPVPQGDRHAPCKRAGPSPLAHTPHLTPPPSLSQTKGRTRGGGRGGHGRPGGAG